MGDGNPDRGVDTTIRAVAVAIPLGLATTLLLAWGRDFPWLMAAVSGASTALLAFVSVLSLSRLTRLLRGPSFKVESSPTEPSSAQDSTPREPDQRHDQQ